MSDVPPVGASGPQMPRPTELYRRGVFEVPDNGAAAAAALGAGIGMVTLGGANLLSSLFQPFEETLNIASRLFFPGGDQVSSYGGKEIAGLLGWLVSWLILHLLLRRRQVSLTTTAVLFVTCIVVSTLLYWPPFIALLARAGRVAFG